MNDDPAPALKEMFNAERYRALAEIVARIHPGFDRARFLDLTLTGLAERSLMERMRRTTEALHATLPDDFPAALRILRRLAPEFRHNFASIVLPDYVSLHGLDHFDLSLDALKFFTPFGSSEFAVRPFLLRDQARTLAVMEAWSRDPDEHVRRLASEGCRPRLPWAARLPALIADPAPVVPILENLKSDPSLYVRKSVANHLNDISKDHPGWLLAWIAQWDRTNPHTDWIIRRGVRSLVKAGHADALAFHGATEAAQIEVARFAVAPKRIRLGDAITLAAEIASTARQPQRLVIDYVVHYAKASGRASEKVFKWKQGDLAAGATLVLKKRQVVRDFSTRRHHPGRHRVELQVNGRRLAETAFVLAAG